VKQLLAILVIAAWSTVARAQVTCQTFGNTTNCNGSLGGSTISDNGAFNSNLSKISAAQFGPNAVALQQQAAAQAQLANQQARLTAQQAEYVRLQTEALERQQQTEELQRQQQAEALRKQQDAEASQRQQQADALLRQQQADASPKLQNASWYDLFMACIRRFPPGKTSDEVGAISDRCERNTSADPSSHQVALSVAPISARSQQASTAGTRTLVRQKWSALDDALAAGVITRAEYDSKLSALLEKQ
jgi:hypothetical protein